VRETLEGAHELPGLGELGPACSTALDVRVKRCDAEPGLAVEKLIDFVRE
jgi:hypothetical protein